MIITDVLRYDDRLFVIAPFSARVALRNKHTKDPEAFNSLEFTFHHLEESILKPVSAALLPLEWGSPFEMPDLNDTLSICERHPPRDGSADDVFNIHVLRSTRITAKRRSLVVQPMGRCWISSGRKSIQADLLEQGWAAFDNPHSTALSTTMLHWKMPTHKEIWVRDIVDLRLADMSGLPKGRKSLHWSGNQVRINNSITVECYWEVDGEKLPLTVFERSAVDSLMSGSGFRMNRDLRPA